MKKKQNIKDTMTRRIGLLPVLTVAMTLMVLVISAPAAWAGREVIEFDEAFIFFELNDTDGDLGIHAKIDGDPWKWLKIRDHRNRKLLDIHAISRLRRQGLTEIFFESAEPPFESDDPDEEPLAPEEFFERFPEGYYTISGGSLEGDRLKSEVEITHVMPAPPNIRVGGFPAAEDCDADLPVVNSNLPVYIEWDAVVMSHDEIGTPGIELTGDHEVVNYEVVVEIDETSWVTSTILPVDARVFQVPTEILELVDYGDEVKFEVLVREASYNQTAVESCFVKGP